MTSRLHTYNGYFDYAAASPLDPDVFAAMRPYFSEVFYNPSAQYLAGGTARQGLEDARAKVGKVLGARPSSIIFTAGGTEANNLAIRGVMDKFPGTNVIISAIEHDSVIEPARKYNFKTAPVNPKGELDLIKLEKLIDDKTVLVSIMYANNEIGTVQPLSKIARMIENVRKSRQRDNNHLPIYLHTDACQAANYLSLQVSRLGVDMMTLNGGKIYGPKQSGVLYASRNVELAAQILGGGQEHGYRSGTENVAFAAGFSLALEIAQNKRPDEVKRLKHLLDYAIKDLKQIKGLVINGSQKNRLPNNLHITLEAKDNERLLIQLDEAGFQLAAGSACSAASAKTPRVLRAIGLSEEQARSSLRITMGRHTSLGSLKKLLAMLKKLSEN